MDYNFKAYKKYIHYDNSGYSGLYNFGNTCYFNTLIQCLLNSFSLSHFFTEAQNYLSKDHFKRNEFRFIVEYNKVLAFYFKQINVNKPIKPSNLLKTIKQYYPKFNNTEQQDTAELLDVLFSLFHDALYNTIVPPIDLPGKNLLKINNANNHLYTQIEGKYSIINHLFTSQFINKLICTDCKTIHYNYDIVNYVSLSIPLNKHNISLSDCLYHNKTEANIKLNCTKCSKSKNDYKSFNMISKFIKLPKNLIIHLKRFDNQSHKIFNFISYPLHLNMAPYSATTLYINNSFEYSLYAIILHEGNNCNSGHYKAIIKKNNKWYMYNDLTIREIKESEINTNNAYMLFYTQNENL